MLALLEPTMAIDGQVGIGDGLTFSEARTDPKDKIAVLIEQRERFEKLTS